ncbi:MAG: recombination protein RecR [Candidatus Liptonbacteria bacterium]|nr:recombination protein RecR [Candidatus Liptonbacteria bacterium]
MTRLPESIRRLIEQLSDLPSLGPRQARRLVFHLIGLGKNSIHDLAMSMRALEGVKICSQCFFVHENEGLLCDICGNAARKKGVIALVEKETDLLSIEHTGKFSGRYLILGSISKTGLLEEWQKLRLQALKNFAAKELGGKADEIIIALNPTANGDFHASALMRELRPIAQKITRLGRGLPSGGEIEFADDETLGSALEKRS